jgi:hypothetical protein
MTTQQRREVIMLQTDISNLRDKTTIENEREWLLGCINKLEDMIAGRFSRKFVNEMQSTIKCYAGMKQFTAAHAANKKEI